MTMGQEVEVTIPLNPADNLTVFPVNKFDLTGTAAGVYRHKMEEKAKYLTILYMNLSENNIILTLGEIIAHVSMCAVEKKKNP